MKTITEAEDLAQQVRAILVGHDPHVIGAALAELLAMLLASMLSIDEDTGKVDEAETNRVRTEILHAHIATTMQLIPPMFEQYVKPQLGSKTVH